MRMCTCILRCARVDDDPPDAHPLTSRYPIPALRLVHSNEPARLITRQTESTETRPRYFDISRTWKSLSSEKTWAGEGGESISRETRSNSNEGNSGSDKSSGDLQPPGAYVTRDEYDRPLSFSFKQDTEF